MDCFVASAPRNDVDGSDSTLSLSARPGLSRDPYAAAVILRKVSNAGVLTDGPRRMGPGSSPGRRWRLFWLRVLAARSAGGLQELSPPKGSGECRVRAAPAVSCAKCTRKAHTSIRVKGNRPATPRAMVLRFMP